MGGAGNISVRRAGSPVCLVHCSVLNLENGAWHVVGTLRIFIKRMKVENDQTFCGLTTESEVCTWVSHTVEESMKELHAWCLRKSASPRRVVICKERELMLWE